MVRANFSAKKSGVAALLICAVIFSGCSSGDTSSNTANRPVSSEVYTETAAKSAPANAPAARMEEFRNGDFGGTTGERYAEISENPFLEVSRAPLSTFSIDVDTASYANVRRMLNQGIKPPADAVRIEEMVNYFEYDYPQPEGNLPFSVNTELAACPWNPKHKILQIGLQGRRVPMDNLPPSNLVFLLDVSGSMNAPDKLPLLKQGMKTLVRQLSPRDRVAIVVYAGASGVVLESTPASDSRRILSAFDSLTAGGSTNGGQGIKLAYNVARQNFLREGNNRVILATDGDFNVGLTGDNELVSLVERERQSGIFLSVLGFGSGNLNDSMMEKLADKGNGNYSYIDNEDEANKALGRQVAGTLYTIAKDVKIQAEFNPARVAGYRLLGYENRLLADRDFNDDRKDAGEIGSGHSVTALYEIIPAGQPVENPGVDRLKYSDVQSSDTRFGDELMTVKLRYKEPQGTESRLLQTGVLDRPAAFENASENLRFATAVAGFGMILRNSRYRGSADYDLVARIAESAVGNDINDYRSDFLGLVRRARTIRN